MKRLSLMFAVWAAVIMMLGACGTAYPDDLVSADNAVAFISRGSVAEVEAGTAYGDIIKRMGATRDEGTDGAHTAVYLVDGDSFLYLSYQKLTDKCPQSGTALLDGLQSALGIRGVVTDITQSGDAITMLVEEEPETDVLMKASVRVDGKTAIVSKDGESVGIDAIGKGDAVEVVFDGPVAESYPLQGRALRVAIVDGGDEQ